MNRITVITIALAILVAHALAIHQSSDGSFAPPYEIAHVAYRIARNLVHHGTVSWIPGGLAAESYPSPLWIAICFVPERLYINPTVFTQWVGVLCAAGTLVALAQFSTHRLAGLIAPVLLAASGSAAAAATSGTEAPLVMLLATASFLAFERRWRFLFSVSTSLMVLARPEGIGWVLALLLFEFLAPPERGKRGLRRAFLPPIVVLGTGILIRGFWTGSWISPFMSSVFDPDLQQWKLGGTYIWSFIVASGSGWLVLLPLVVWLSGSLGGTGKRALLMATLWAVLVLSSGGDSLPMWNAMAPILPVFFICIQEAFGRAIDANPRRVNLLTGMVGVAFVASFVVSKSPGNIGPIPLESLQRAWLAPRGPMKEAFPRPLGRTGLATEIRDVERLRALSTFLRDKIREPSTILTLWPGAIGYVSRKQVFDLLGRAYPAHGSTATQSWRGSPRIDLIAAFETGPDYVVPAIDPLADNLTPVEIMHRLLSRHDVIGDTAPRFGQLVRALQPYELIAAPVPEEAARPGRTSPSPFLILRREGLKLAPILKLVREKDEIIVLVHHEGHRQVVDLELWLSNRQDRRWHLRPTGEFVPDEPLAARTDLLLYDSGQRDIELIRIPVPSRPRARTLSARLINPGFVAEKALVAASKSVTLQL